MEKETMNIGIVKRISRLKKQTDKINELENKIEILNEQLKTKEDKKSKDTEEADDNNQR